MGNCPCCPKRDGNYNPYVEDDDDYREYDSPHARGYSKPLVSNSAPNTQTSHYSHANRPPDESTYSPPSLPPPRGTSLPAHPLHSTPPTSTTPPSTQSQQRQYTEYSESLYLARHPEQPTDSMLLDSMMKSSFLDRRQGFPPPGNNGSSSGSQFDGGSSLVDSTYGSASVSVTGSMMTNTQGPDFAASTAQSVDFAASTAQSVDFAASTAQSVDFAASTAQSVDFAASTAHSPDMGSSTSSSIYYDAPGNASFMMGSVNEGAFEPTHQ
jgi:hypothetical protein